jgi:hypothetical protein
MENRPPRFRFEPPRGLWIAWALMAMVVPALAKSYLVDFNSAKAWRGVDPPSVDADGNRWNALPHPVGGSSQLNGLVDTAGGSSLIDVGFSTPFAMDSYNGPAGVTSNPPTAQQIAATDIDAVALGMLGVKEAAIDYIASISTNGTKDARFAIQGLDPLLTYTLDFFGSLKYSANATTVYEAYTDADYTLLAASARLDICSPANGALHNRNKVATLPNMRPSAGGTIYVRFRGSGGGPGYLNSLRIVEGSRPLDGRDVSFVSVQNPGSSAQITAATSGDPLASPGQPPTNLRSHWYLLCRGDTSVVWILNRITGQALRAPSDTGAVALASWNPEDARQAWKMEPLTRAGGPVTRLRIDGTQAALTFSANNSVATVSPLDTANQAQDWILPEIPRGAAMPWTTYDEENCLPVAAPAEIIRSAYADGPVPLAAEAQKRGVVLLNGINTTVRWTAVQTANALTLRYSVEDGLSGNLTLRILDGNSTVSSQKVPVTSAQAWVYFDSQGVEHQSPATGRIPAKRFNEARIKLSPPLQTGQTLEFRRESGDAMVWIDLVDAESSELVARPSTPTHLSVKDAPYNAKGDGATNDTTAIKNCIAAAAAGSKCVYIPPGTYLLDSEIAIPPGVTVQGAGMWHAEWIFTRSATMAYSGQGLGGVSASGSKTVLRDLYLKSAQSARSLGYKGIKGSWGTGSVIENVWVDQAEVGAWIADFTNNGDIYTDGLLMRGCRMRNAFADGINYASGTRNSIVENCHIRGCGDDGIASWASGRTESKPTTRNQQFRYNTVECVYRAGGIGVFGGEGHKIHHNIVRDQVAGPGIRLNTIFLYENGILKGYPFGSQLVEFYDNSLERTGSLSVFNEPCGAIELQTWYSDVKNLRFSRIDIATSRYEGIRFSKLGSTTGPAFANILFSNVTFSGVPFGTLVAPGAGGRAGFDAATSSAGIANQSPSFTIDGPPPPPPSITSFAPTACPRGGTLTIRGFNLGTTNLVQIGAQSAASFAILDDSTVTAVVPQTAVDGRITLTTTGGADSTSQLLTITQGNNAPVITLGHPASLSLAAGNGLLLSANLTDDGVPQPGNLTSTWSVAQAPAGGTATFDNPSLATTGVSFSANGTYLLRLTASDGAIQNSADVTVASGLPNSGSPVDVGAVGLSGSSSESGGVWTLRGSGNDIWDTADGFHFRCAELTGDGFIQARLLAQTNTDLWAKAGLMIRDSLEAGSSHVLLAGTIGNGLALQHRPAAGALSQHDPRGPYTSPVWLRLVRTGSAVRAYTSPDGSHWTQTGADLSPTMTGTVFIGLVVTSHNNSALSEATFDNLQGSGFGSAIQAVSAGPDRSAVTGLSTLLEGSAPGASSVEWKKISGPALDLASPLSLSTTAVPSASGTYLLRFLARSGSTTIFDELLLTAQAAPTPMAAWQTTRFGSTTSPQAAWAADPDNDTLSNLLEFALGGDPLAPDAVQIQPRMTSTASGPVFEFRRRRGSGSGSTAGGYTLDGIRYLIEVSPSITSPSWATGPSLIEQAGAPIDNADGTETLRVRLVEPSSAAFLRLRIE